jgi:hypothetical protein
MIFNKKSIVLVFGVLQFLGAQAASVSKYSLHSPPVFTRDACEGQEDGTMLPDPENCQYFFVCYDGEAALASCLRRNCFDPEISNCRPCAGCGYKADSEQSSPIEV